MKNVQTPLAKWISDKGITQLAFARRVECNHSTISRICAGLTGCREDLARRIVKETRGKVTMVDLFPRSRP